MSISYGISGNGENNLQSTTETILLETYAWPPTIGLQQGGSAFRLFGAGWITESQNPYGVMLYHQVDFTVRIIDLVTPYPSGGARSLQHHLTPGVLVQVTEFP